MQQQEPNAVKSRQTGVRIYLQRDGRPPEALPEESYSLEDYGGVAPSVGDLIIAAGHVVGADRQDPKNRTIYEVVARYFSPTEDQSMSPMVDLVVTAREGTFNEINILG